MEIKAVVGFGEVRGNSDWEGPEGHFWVPVIFHFLVWLSVTPVGSQFEVLLENTYNA